MRLASALYQVHEQTRGRSEWRSAKEQCSVGFEPRKAFGLEAYATLLPVLVLENPDASQSA